MEDVKEIERFKQRLIEKENPQEVIDQAVSILNEYHNFLTKRNTTFEQFTKNDFYEYTCKLIEEKRNESFVFEIFLIFGRFAKIPLIEILAMEAFDGGEVMENFSKRLTEEYSQDFRNEIFAGVELPPLGLHPGKKPDYTKTVVKKFIGKVGKEEAEKFLSNGLRDSYYEFRKADRELFLESENLDDFLLKKNAKFLKTLEKHRDDNTIFFNQPINDQVIEYVKNNKDSLEGGIREGNIIYETKIPAEAIKYLNETDPKMKIYYYCHCPWVKETIKDGTLDQIPKEFCNCSGGYYKAYWEIVLEKPVEVKLLESVIRGDPHCRFALTIPDEFVKDLD